MSNWPFNADLPKNQWTEIQADGFPEPVPGCVYDGHRLDGGIPLGGLGTGYFTLEGSGLRSATARSSTTSCRRAPTSPSG